MCTIFLTAASTWSIRPTSCGYCSLSLHDKETDSDSPAACRIASAAKTLQIALIMILPYLQGVYTLVMISNDRHWFLWFVTALWTSSGAWTARELLRARLVPLWTPLTRTLSRKSVVLPSGWVCLSVVSIYPTGSFEEYLGLICSFWYMCC